MAYTITIDERLGAVVVHQEGEWTPHEFGDAMTDTYRAVQAAGVDLVLVDAVTRPDPWDLELVDPDAVSRAASGLARLAGVALVYRAAHPVEDHFYQRFLQQLGINATSFHRDRHAAEAWLRAASATDTALHG